MFPKERDVPAFYGDPNGTGGRPSAAWERANLTIVKFPWKAVAAWDTRIVIPGARVHVKCAASLTEVLGNVWALAGRDQRTIQEIGMHLFGGGYNFRLIRGGSRLSMHAYGAAVDFDPQRNGLGDATPAMDRDVVRLFEAAGWTWGGRWSGGRCDGMHFQATAS